MRQNEPIGGAGGAGGGEGATTGRALVATAMTETPFAASAAKKVVEVGRLDNREMQRCLGFRV